VCVWSGSSAPLEWTTSTKRFGRWEPTTRKLRCPSSIFRPSGEPPVGEMLTHWYNATQHDHRATTALVPGNHTAYRLVAQLGYTMTAPNPKGAFIELEECVSKWPDTHTTFSFKKAPAKTRTIGVYAAPDSSFSAAQPNTQALYRCYSDTEKSGFAANRDDCNGMGKREALPGYDLKQ
jgi:hypothetical protein